MIHRLNGSASVMDLNAAGAAVVEVLGSTFGADVVEVKEILIVVDTAVEGG